MASSKKLSANKTASLPHQLQVFLKDVFFSKQLINPKLVLGLSGGLDSVVLLHLLSTCNQSLAFKLTAHHVHHGLSPNADAWANFCAETCKKLSVPFCLTKVKINKNSGLGVESAAREARYQALFSADADLICVAHHQDDQAETLLLQLARGAGVKGLASMGAVKSRLVRPLLNVPRSDLVAYARLHALAWIEDESNLDTKFDRNFMRHEILPILSQQYTAIRQTLARTANHLAEADVLLDDLAKLDIAACQQDMLDTRQIYLKPMADLSDARIHNALRWWLSLHACDIPSASKLMQIKRQLFTAKLDANIKIKVSASMILRRFQDRAFLVNVKKVAIDSEHIHTLRLVWQGEKVMTLPDQSCLRFSKKMGAGIAMRHVESAQLNLRYRQGGESLKLAENRPSRTLKSVFQTANIPPWQRDRLPLVFLAESLVAVANIAVSASIKAHPDELGLLVTWQDSA